MRISKKITSVIAAAAAALSMTAVPALADDAQQTQSTEFSYTAPANDPTYTVTIPAALSLTDEGTALDITASDVADLNGKRVSVTIAGTNYYRNQMVLQARTSKPMYTGVIRYQFIGADGSIIETTGDDTVSGKEIASFTDNGTVTYTAKPVIDKSKQNLEPGVSYTGTMNFGISLAD